jgi:hypothetical protein
MEMPFMKKNEATPKKWLDIQNKTFISTGPT